MVVNSLDNDAAALQVGDQLVIISSHIPLYHTPPTNETQEVMQRNAVAPPVHETAAGHIHQGCADNAFDKAWHELLSSCTIGCRPPSTPALASYTHMIKLKAKVTRTHNV